MACKYDQRTFSMEEMLTAVVETGDESGKRSDMDSEEEELINEGLDPNSNRYLLL